MCVQKFDDSRGPAIRITYRISLRSSSLWEPRHPLLKVVNDYLLGRPLPKQLQYPLDSDTNFFLVKFGVQPSIKKDRVGLKKTGSATEQSRPKFTG